MLMGHHMFQMEEQHQVIRGKYAYMAPEQVEGRVLTGQTDIFALSIVLWELLTGAAAAGRCSSVPPAEVWGQARGEMACVQGARYPLQQQRPPPCMRALT